MKSFRNSIVVSLAAAIPALAQIQAGSLKPAGGETFAVGSNISFEWVATQAHDGKYDVYISKDGGATFPTELVGPFQGSTTDGAKNTYVWKATAAWASTQVRFRICQLYGGHCTQPGVYTVVSPANFTITTSTALSPEARKDSRESRLAFSADDKNLTVAFSLAEEKTVSLKAYDVTGNLITTVAEAKIGAGAHRYTLPSSQVDLKGPLVFKLQVGGEAAITQVWTGL